MMVRLIKKRVPKRTDSMSLYFAGAFAGSMFEANERKAQAKGLRGQRFSLAAHSR